MKPSHLDDPNPPPPPAALLDAIEHRARRRRATIAAASALTVAAAVAVFALAGGDDRPGDEVAATTQPPQQTTTSTPAPTTTIDPDTLEVAVHYVPDGFLPSTNFGYAGGEIERLGWESLDRGGIIVERLRAHQAVDLVDIEEVAGANGRTYLLGYTLDRHRRAQWFTPTGDVITLYAAELADDELVAILDATELVPTEPGD